MEDVDLNGMQALRTTIGDMITLDFRKITGKGITLGSSFHVAELAHASCRFGSTCADAHATQVNMAQHQVSLSHPVLALHEQVCTATNLHAGEHYGWKQREGQRERCEQDPAMT